jgi:hypothetical protein
MLNEKAAELSRNALPLQKENLKKAYPFFRVINVTDSSYDGQNAICVKMDYYNGIDAYALDLEGRKYNIQFKVREPGHNDLVFIVRKVTDSDMIRNPNFGFTFGGNKYSFILNDIDIFCEMVNGKIYNVRATDLMSLEYDTKGRDNPFIKNVCPQEYFDSKGQKFHSGNYYAFISVEGIMELKELLMKAENREHYYVNTYQQEQ